jgi:hypothetical protein
MKKPKGAITSAKQVKQLIARAKREKIAIPAFHYDPSDGAYMYRIITSESSFDPYRGGLHYFDRHGHQHSTGTSFYRHDGDWCLFTNYWFAYAYALKFGLPFKEYKDWDV